MDIKFIDKLILCICSVFMLGGVANLGVTGFFWSLPFWALFIYRTLRYQNKTVMQIFALTLLLSLPLMLKESNPLFFPQIGTQIELRTDSWTAKRFQDSEHYSLWQDWPQGDDYYVISTKDLNEGLTLTMTKVSISHPEFVTSLWPVFVDENGTEYTISEQSLFEAIEADSIYSKDLKNVSHIQSRWTYYLGFSMNWLLLFI